MRAKMPPTDANADGKPRRLMHHRSVECLGYLREDGLWEVEAQLVDTKPYARRDRYRGDQQPGDPVHDIRLRLAIDDTFLIHEAGTTMQSTPYATCVNVEGILQRLVGERIGKGWREIVRRKIGKLETCTHLQELLGPAVTTLFQTVSRNKNPEDQGSFDRSNELTEPPFFVGGCYSWRLDGPVVADMFPQFAVKRSKQDVE
jgi:hypothetical protein